MPPPVKLTKDQILDAALELVRQKGAEALNARALANALHCSTQPIFSNFATMEVLRAELLQRAEALYLEKLQKTLSEEKYPPYKAYGMGYIRFARQEPILFRWLFMRDRAGEDQRPTAEWNAVAAEIQRITGLNREAASAFHLKMWIFVHGIATMIATGYLNFDEQTVSGLLTEYYQIKINQIKECGSNAGN